MNQEKHFTPVLLASFTYHRVKMWNVGLSSYFRGADQIIEFDNNNVLGNLYRSFCKNTSHIDLMKLLWLKMQKTYEKTGKEKEKIIEEEPYEQVYDDFFY